MQQFIDKTDERYLALDFWLLLTPAANLNRPIKPLPARGKA
ncbi:hypothetical protein [Oceaniovalibus sp. ACAM 378]|jgi:hypothetical protein|nr:hypothetical protein [Oceaniovalibus sp. ACAM 378]